MALPPLAHTLLSKLLFSSSGPFSSRRLAVEPARAICFQPQVLFTSAVPTWPEEKGPERKRRFLRRGLQTKFTTRLPTGRFSFTNSLDPQNLAFIYLTRSPL